MLFLSFGTSFVDTFLKPFTRTSEEWECSLITQVPASMCLPLKSKKLKTSSSTKLLKKLMISQYLEPSLFLNLRKMSVLDMEPRVVAMAVTRADMAIKEDMGAARVVTVSLAAAMASKAMAYAPRAMVVPRADTDSLTAAMDNLQVVMASRDNNKAQTGVITPALCSLETSVSSTKMELIRVSDAWAWILSESVFCRTIREDQKELLLLTLQAQETTSRH